MRGKEKCVLRVPTLYNLRFTPPLLFHQGDQSDPRNVAEALYTALCDETVRAVVAVNGQMRTVSTGLIYTQIDMWLGLLQMINGAPPEQRHGIIAREVVQRMFESPRHRWAKEDQGEGEGEGKNTSSGRAG